MGVCYLFSGREKEADFYFAKSISVCKQLKDTAGMATALINMANQYYASYKDQKAIDYFTKGLQLALLTYYSELKQTAYLNMAVVTENKKDYRHALLYRKNYEVWRDSFYKRDNIWNFAQEEKKLAAKDSERRVEKM